jgi:hypothetical protein
MHTAVLKDCSLCTLFLAYQTTTRHLQDCRLLHFFPASDLFWCVFCRCSSESVSVTLSESFILLVWQNECSLRGHEASAHCQEGMPCEMDKFGPSSFLWASFLAGAISDSCESSLLLRFFPSCYLSLECTRNSLLWLGSPAVQAFHYAVQLHESDIALGGRKGLKLLMLCQPFELWGCSLDR